MKTKILLLFLLGWVGMVCGQESFKKVYRIPNLIRFKSGEIICLQWDSSVKFKDLTHTQQKSIKKNYESGSFVTIEEPLEFNSEKKIVTKTVKVDKDFYDSLIVKESNITDTIFKGYVKFEENKVIVNPFIYKIKKENNEEEYKRNAIHYYKLKNRQSIRLCFNEITVSALTIPFKYRFKHSGVPEEFSAGININLFGGFSIGKTRFFHQDKVGNKENTYKFTFGGLLGSSIVELNNSNTSMADKPLATDEKMNKGVASIGLGIVYSFNKINLGAFCGWDFAMGKDSNKWDYNKKTWLGIALGYSLFNF
ncbi:hypothetical protein [Chryseobacterium sp. HR92]|uniref:hypothetical protein n=1 Tax=Chryseobacterium sp. HR92 TaxID=3094839 RepID=UPI00388E5230|nr:hypothetical protein SFA27_03655 [Chryseobacterium sp. HR92]